MTAALSSVGEIPGRSLDLLQGSHQMSLLGRREVRHHLFFDRP
jgi:hypothetical protein